MGSYKAILTFLLFVALVAAQEGQQGGEGGGGGGGAMRGNPAFAHPTFDITTFKRVKVAHGVIGSAAYVIFFPTGAITIRLIPGRLAFLMHVAFEIIAWVLAMATFGMGVWLANTIHFGDTWLIKDAHSIIGIIVFMFILVQPISGFVHHVIFKKEQRRTGWSYVHLWVGRVIVTLGIINGGLGLRLANNTEAGKIVYGVLAGIIWLIWMGAAVWSEINRARRPAPPKTKESQESFDSTRSA